MEEGSDRWLVKCPKCGHVFGDARFLSDISPCWCPCPECKRMTDIARIRWDIVIKNV